MKKFLKKTALWLGLILLALILFSFLLPSEIKIKRSIIVNAPADRVFDQVNDLRNWEKWSPWKRHDPTMVMTFSNPPVGEKAFYKWESQDKHMAKGTMTLSRVVPFELIETTVEMEKQDPITAKFDFAHKDNGIEVTWTMHHDVGVLPWNRYMGLMIRGMVKKQYDEGLKAIKFYTEKS